MDKVETFLEHFGVKGMKWGRRKASSQSEDSKRHSEARSKKVSELDDKELQKLVNRINMEKQLNNLTPSVTKKGHAAVKSILAVGATVNTAILFAQTPAGKAIGKHLRDLTTIP